MNTPDPRIAKLAFSLRQRACELSTCHVVAGFDGFVDEIISVVQERKSLDQWTPVPDINTFGNRIKAAAGRSGLHEIIVHRIDPGGCSVNLGDGLIALGLPLDCFATLGQPRHAAFGPFAASCNSCHSWGPEPGRTMAFEFSDGKLMFSAVTQLAGFDCQMLNRALADGQYARACSRARLIALTDWSLYPHMTECWRKLQAEVFSQLRHRPIFFLDLVDPSSRSEADIKGMMDALRGFEEAGPTVLGVNGTEANVLARILGMPAAKEDISEIKNQAAALREKLGISQVVTHCVKLAARADTHGAWGVAGPYCAKPKKSTGAGDRFNAGYCAALLLGLDAEECLLLGSGSSGYFVRQAKSAKPLELADFLDRWASGKLV
jgi:hypothetical protein